MARFCPVPRLPGLLLAASVAAAALPAQASEPEGEIIVSHGISTFGALTYPADFPHLAYVNPEAPRGGEMSLWTMGGFDSMHPYTTRGRAGALSSVFFESLLEGTADTVDESYCLVCETLEYPEDRSWVIFNMRPEVRFSDGSPLTAEDVVFSYEILLEKGLPDFRFVLAQQVERAEALGPHRVKFTFKEGWPTRDLPSLVGGLPIFSRAHYIENDRDFEQSSMQPLMGSGPYVLARADAGQTIIYQRNPDYWGWHLPMRQGRWNFDRIRIEYFADYDAAFEAFKAGTYHFRTEARALLWATGYDFPAMQRGHVVRAELPDGNLASGQSFIFNLRREKFQDIRVREAIGLMFNFEWSNEALFNSLYARIHSFWENSEMAATGLPTPEELAILEPLRPLLRPEVFTEPAVMAASSGERQLDRANLARAAALLDDAGWPVQPPPPRDPRLPVPAAALLALLLLGAAGYGVARGGTLTTRAAAGVAGIALAGASFWYLGTPVAVPDDGLRRNDAGEVLRVEFLNDNTGFDRIIEPFVSNLRRLGIDARMTRVDSAQMTNRERSYDFDIITDQIRMSLTPGSNLKQYFGSETADVSTFNKMGLKSEAVDRLIDVVLAARSREELTHATRALDRVLRSYRFWVPQWYKDTHWVAYFDMYEHPENMPPYALGQVDFWWFDAEKAAALRAAGALR